MLQMRLQTSLNLLCVVLCIILIAGCMDTTGSVPAARVAGDPGALVRLADATARSGDAQGAANLYQKAAALQPDLLDAQIGRARALAEQGHFAEAATAAKMAHLQAPEDARTTVILGRLQLAAHHPEEAHATFEDGLHRAPENTALLIACGVALDALGNHAVAQAKYRQALAGRPNSVVARNNLALSLGLSGRAPEGIALLKSSSADITAFGAPDEIATAQGNLALLYGLEGDLPQAAALAKRVLPAGDASNNLALYAALLDGAGQFEGKGPSNGDASPAAVAAGAVPGAAIPAAPLR